MRGRSIRRLAGPMLAAIATAALMGAPAMAQGGFDGEGPHDGGRGLHWLLDMALVPPEYPAVTCRYNASYQLRRMQVRPPIVYADVSEGPRTQRVGWRAIVQSAPNSTGPWSTYAKGPLRTADASGRYPAPFRPVSIDLPGSVTDHPYYRVNHRLTWYGPNGTTQTGVANHWPRGYGIKAPDGGSWTLERCESALSGTAVAGLQQPQMPHWQNHGPHWIPDTPGNPPEFPAVTCEYDLNGIIESVHIRRPIVLARNTGPGIQRQDVAWKAIVQYSPAAKGPVTWYPLTSTDTTRRSATELDWAAWLPKRVGVDASKGVLGIRVVYRMTWYKGTSTKVVGRAQHAPAAYLVDPRQGPSWVTQQYCATGIPT